MLEYGSFAISLIGIGLSIIVYDLEFNEIEPDWSYIMLWAVFISSILLGVLNIIKELFYLDYAKNRHIISIEDTLKSTGRWKYLVFEIIVCLIGPSPFLIGIRIYYHTLYDNHLVYLHVNEILIMLLFPRILFMVRALLLSSQYSSNRSQRICSMNTCEADVFYVIKCYMKENPLFFVASAMLISIPYMAFLLRVSENPLSRLNDLDFYYDSYFNCMWNIIVTSTTAGYGDYYPKTLLGRIVVIFTCGWGVFMLSMMVVSITNLLKMEEDEIMALTLLKKLEYKNELRKEAAYIITISVRNWLRFRKSKNNKASQVNKINLTGLSIHLKNFKYLGSYHLPNSIDYYYLDQVINPRENIKDHDMMMNDVDKHPLSIGE